MRFESIQTIPGISRVAEVYAQGETAWYRASLENAAVLLRIGTSPEGSAELRREMEFHQGELAAAADSPAIPRPTRLMEHGELTVLIFPDVPGRPVASINETGKFDLNSFLIAATELCALLGELHGAGLAHGGGLAQNVFFDAEDFEIFLLGLGAAAESSRSPEADLRNLGVLFYGMLHGQSPGANPEPLSRLHPGFPEVVSEIIMKLLGIAEPYQSMAGLHPDLRSCAQQLEVFKTIENFVPGRMDRPLSRA